MVRSTRRIWRPHPPVDRHVGRPRLSRRQEGRTAGPARIRRRAALRGPREIYQQSVKGRLRTIKWAVLVGCLAVYYFLPFLRWYRGPNQPDQAVLVDIANNRFYFFFIEIWPQEIYYFTGLLVMAALVLFLMNAVAGRVWCGYLCPQTVWTDLFTTVERWVEGDRRERMMADAQPMTAAKFGRKTLKHFSG